MFNPPVITTQKSVTWLLFAAKVLPSADDTLVHLLRQTRWPVYVQLYIVAHLPYHCCRGKTTIRSVYIVNVCITVSGIKILSVAQI